MKGYNIDNFAVLIGIDWADKKHDICEHPNHTEIYNYSIIKHKPQALHDWAMELKQRYPEQKIAIVCELKKGPLIYALAKYEHLTLFTINPSAVAKYRKAFTPSGAKDDPSDALIQVEILTLHMDKLSVIEPESAAIRSLSQLVEYRRGLVQNSVDLSNKITATLKNYYPQALEWFKEKDTIIFCNFIIKWPSLGKAKRARKQALLDFFNAHNSRYVDVNNKRILGIKNAMPLTEDKGVIEPNQMLVEVLISQFKVLLQGIEQLDKAIKGVTKRKQIKIYLIVYQVQAHNLLLVY
ncbi:IS110 family transposase [Psychromonas sp. SR45-3]|uniref:IS110 family transposase n=1 Tax=Psychromonas sp. SR45-3 TaxID=2760930 RepID=UPI002175F9FC|nr:IS110 family transposase [Psychromonas sp. SR45-3]